MPLQPRHGYAAGFHHGLPASDADQPRSSPPDRSRLGARCRPAQINRVSSWRLLLRGVQPLVSHVRLSVWLAGPGPSGCSGPSRRCQGCFPPFLASPSSGCPQLHPARCDEPEAVSFHHRKVRKRLWRNASQHHNWLGCHCTQSGHGFFVERSGRGAPTSVRP